MGLGDPEFAANGSRKRPTNDKKTAWMHRHTLCTYLWMKLHVHVKSNPGDVHLFDPLPAGQDPTVI